MWKSYDCKKKSIQTLATQSAFHAYDVEDKFSGCAKVSIAMNVICSGVVISLPKSEKRDIKVASGKVSGKIKYPGEYELGLPFRGYLYCIYNLGFQQQTGYHEERRRLGFG